MLAIGKSYSMCIKSPYQAYISRPIERTLIRTDWNPNFRMQFQLEQCRLHR